jgi:transcriptional regulator with AAA-type ATPase domain
MTEEKTDEAADANKILKRSRKSSTPGWMHPLTAFRFYWANGQVRQLIGRFATTIAKSGWTYTNSNVKGFVWAPTQSKLETLKLKAAQQLATKWAFVFGGAAIEHITEDPGSASGEKCDPKTVQDYKGLKVWSAYDLRPEGVADYRSAQYFVAHGTGRRIHRSRLSIIVVEDVPTSGAGGSVYTTKTGWPPSWLEGIYASFCSLKDAHYDADQMLATKSLVHLALEGWRKVQTSPDSDEAAEAQAALESTLQLLNNEGVLVTDVQDVLKEISRDLSHVADLIERKEIWWASASGAPTELVNMEAEGNLGTNSAPIDAYNDSIDGWRQTMYTPVIEDSTDRALAAQRFETEHATSEPFEVPDEYTVVHDPVQEQTGEEAAKQREGESKSRFNDFKTGVPLDVILSDPRLQSDYTGMSAFLEQRAETQKKAKEKAVEQGEEHPEGEDMISAAAVAAKLGCSPSTVLKMAKAGTIPGRPIAGRYKFYLSRVLAAVSSNEVEAAEAEDRRMDECERAAARDELGLSSSTMFGEVYGASAAMREIFAVLEVMRESDIAVMLLGETGVGKEGIARGLHRDGEFVAVNCAALPQAVDELVEAVAKSMSKAKGGTLFLDELGDLPWTGQSALLRELSADHGARVVSATSLDAQGMLRPDLYFRLAGIEIEIPPLRDREQDVHVLAQMFYERVTEASSTEPADPSFTAAARSLMEVYTWPGNVRELNNVVQRGVALAGHATPVGVEHLQLRAGRRGQ